MTGAQCIDAILADDFGPARRTAALGWANDALAAIWNEEEWTFRQASAAVTVTAGSHDVSGLPADYGVALALQRADGQPLRPMSEHRLFAARYLGTRNDRTGRPEAFCPLDTDLLVGPASSETNEDYLLEYERAFPAITDTATELGLPVEGHLGVVYGGKQRGMILTKSGDASGLAASYNLTLEALRRGGYLRNPRVVTSQVRAYRPC